LQKGEVMIDKKESARRALDEQRGLIRAIAGNILAATDAATAIRVLTEELEELKASTNQEASEDFMRSITNSGTICILCEFCNRTHFVSEGDFDRGELEKLERYAKEKPDRYIEHFDVDTISWGYLDGKQIVWGCACNSARRYESWIWSHRYAIADYFQLRAKDLQYQAKFAGEVADKAAAIEMV
jgi:hypothetical protein